MVITIFAALGFEHSIANMFVGPFGALQKSSRTSFLKFFFNNLVSACSSYIFFPLSIFSSW
jgi:formate/nitrite transporter FocA (FNT family)